LVRVQIFDLWTEVIDMENDGGTTAIGGAMPAGLADLKAGGEGLHPIRVLLIEDNEEAAVLVRIGLNEDPADPIHVEWSRTIVDGINRLKEPGIDAILLDLGMPELTGYMSFSVIEAAADPVIPVVVLTGDERPHVRALALERGASDYLLKGRSTSLQVRQTLRREVQKNWLV
jgi:DNA-binding response OmpR family regulator